MTKIASSIVESAFETAIETYLIKEGGYEKVNANQFDKRLGLDKTTLGKFIRESQKNTWDKLCVAYGSDVEDKIAKLVASECDKRGLLEVIRNGIQDQGETIELAFFQPVTQLNPKTQQLYQKNCLTVMRQVPYVLNSNRSIDMVLSLNGLPIATAELKNPFTGQHSINAIKQFIQNRVPDENTPLLQYKKRALVHFAVDTDEAYMTTHLKGTNTIFLPFNTGNHGGKGNPVNHSYVTGYKTGYLWEEIWQKDSWIDIIHRFIHLQVEESYDVLTKIKQKKETLIFPRYHQLKATRLLLADTRKGGVGKNYLIQHSAGSGKTHTIAWVTHQLATLHDDSNEPIFNSVVVVSDRCNLDKHLQDSIYQINHKEGVVAKIDGNKHAADLADELNKGSKIIITTLQKFPFLLDKIKDFSTKGFAVIIDEAHSGQSGKNATALRTALSSKTEPMDSEELILKEIKKRGSKQSNINFYAFTATPKPETLEMFGIIKKNQKPEPFHLYSMRQAIEENFIHDVLKYYTTYKTYYQIDKSSAQDPEVYKNKAKQSATRFVSHHPRNIAEKTEIMLKHFLQITAKKINGQAKAMLVTSSRLAAIHYKQSFDQYIAKESYNIKTVIAFSGSIQDKSGKIYTEANMNGFGEGELPQRFATSEYQLLITPDKYQTGFDQPLLHTMFVDKKLRNVKAVQTLSRLNRVMPGKVDTFVLDFVNEVETIQAAFKPYYNQAQIKEITDPLIIYDVYNKLMAEPIFHQKEIDEFATIYFKPRSQQTPQDHGQLNYWVDPAVERYKYTYRNTTTALNEEIYTQKGQIFKKNLKDFLEIYRYLTQITTLQETKLEKLYAYGQYLLAKLPKDNNVTIDLEKELLLTHYRNEKTFEGSAELRVQESQAPYEIVNTNIHKSKPKFDTKVSLSDVIKMLNEQFSKPFTAKDQLIFKEIAEEIAKDTALMEQARVNSKDQFKQIFTPIAIKTILKHQPSNEGWISDFLSNENRRNIIINALLDYIYNQAQEP